MRKIKIKIKTDKLPKYQTPQSSGCDLYAHLTHAVTLLPLDRITIPTGVSIQLPEGYEAQVRGRSGLNKNHGIVCPLGTIDMDYRGEIGATIYNLSREPYTIQDGERIAQLVICPVVQADWNQVQELDDDTERGVKGFGHSGK